MKVSIVMANHNRRKLLINTLKTIEFYNKDRDIEVIVVDDNSDKSESIVDVPGLFKIPVIIIPIEKSDKKWMCCCMPFNIGFSYATGNIIIIQNPENLHVGDIVGYALKHSVINVFLSFALYSMNQEESTKLIKKTISKGIFEGIRLKEAIGTFVGKKEQWKDGDTCWYNHSMYQPAGNHLISAIRRTDLEDLNGFDERYGLGFAYDDFEFKVRILRKKMIIKIIDDPFAVHQRHALAAYDKNKAEFVRNGELLSNCTLKESFYRAPANIFYNPQGKKNIITKTQRLCPVTGNPCNKI